MTDDIKRSESYTPWVFLSASYPSEDRNPRYCKGTDVRTISNAVVELVRAVFEVNGSLVFGGHPTISPLVLQIAESMEIPLGQGDAPRLRIYQSAVFRGRAPQASERIGKLDIGEQIETESVNGESPVFHGDKLDPTSVAKSLKLMRRPHVRGQSARGGGVHRRNGRCRRRVLYRNRVSDCPTLPGRSARRRGKIDGGTRRTRSA